MKLINRMLLLFAVLVSFSACEGDYDMPDFTDPTFTLPSSATLTTISAIRGYESQIGSDGVYRFSGTGVYLKAVVSANDKSGNIFKKIYLQDATGNIEMEVDQSNIFNDYPVGQEVYLDLTGLSLSKYGGELQLGHPDGYNYRTPYIIFKEQAHKNGSPNEKAITVTDVTDFTQLKESDRFSLVRLKKVHFENGGKNKFAPQGANYTTEKLLDSKGNSIDVRTSNYAKFAAETLPAGVGTVVAILGRYNGAWQLTIRSLEDFTDFGDGSGGSDSESGLKFKKVTTVTNGKKYIIAANDNGTYKVAQNVAATKTYGWLYVDDATAKDGVITMDDESHAFTFVANGSDWYIKDESGRYMFMTGTFNSFNVGADATAEGLWTVTPNANGTMKITNKGMSKYIQYSTQHTSYGSYPDEQGIMPELFELQDGDSGSGDGGGSGASGVQYQKATSITSGKEYIIAADDNGTMKVAKNIAANKTYGYLYVDDATDKNGVITLEDDSHGFIIEASGSNYTIKDKSGRYMIMTGTFNSFNLAAESSSEAIWTITKNDNGTFKVMNVGMSKYVQYSTQFTSYGSYADEQGIMPFLYERK